MKKVALCFQKVHYRYSATTKWILNNFNIKVPVGAVWIVTGPIGSGKSTFLHLARGFHKIYGGDFTGDIFIKGHNIAHLNFYEIGKKGIGWVGQNPALNLHQLTVEDEILSGPIYHNLPWNVCLYLTNEIINSLGLKKIAAKSPSELSGGEMQRAAIAAALVMGSHLKENDHGLLLLDEPDSFLDPKGKEELVEILKNLSSNNTIIIATHRFEHYLEIADGITVINDGKNVLSGSPREVLYNEKIKKIIEYPIVEIGRKFQKARIIHSKPLTGKQLISEIRNRINTKSNKIILGQEKALNAITYRDLTYIYPNGNHGVRQLQGMIPTGSITAIVGNNGSGKTTLAKLTLKLFNKYKGAITLLGKDLKLYNRDQLAHIISYITQIPKDMFVTDTVRKECELFPKFQKEINFREKAIEAIKKVGIEEYINSPIDSLSGGESRLLSLAATVFTTETPLVILDEPEFGIDLRTWNKLFQFFQRLKANGKTIVMLTHWLDVTLFCDFVIVMHDGKILKAGHPFEIYQDDKLTKQIGLNTPSLYPLFCFLWRKGYNPLDLSMLIKFSIKELS